MADSFLGGSISVLLAPSLSDGGALIKLRLGLEERYLSLDCHYVVDLDWEHRWLYIPNNEWPLLLTFSHNRLRPDMLELWLRLPTLSEL